MRWNIILFYLYSRLREPGMGWDTSVSHVSEYWRYCQRPAFCLITRARILNISFPRVIIEPATCHVKVMPLYQGWPQLTFKFIARYNHLTFFFYDIAKLTLLYLSYVAVKSSLNPYTVFIVYDQYHNRDGNRQTYIS